MPASIFARRTFSPSCRAVLHVLQITGDFLDNGHVRAVLTRCCEVTTVFLDLISREITDESFSFLINFLQRTSYIVSGSSQSKEQSVLKVSSEPLYILRDGVHELRLLLRRVRIIKTKIELSAVIFARPEFKMIDFACPI